jgi:hypothetical protein
MPRRHGDDEARRDHEAAEDGVRERRQSDLVGEDGPQVGELRPSLRRVEAVPDRVLHEGVRREDEVRRQDGAGRHDPHGGQMQALRQAVPAEDPEADEGRLQEEGEEALQRERRAEDVPDESRVVGPVHPELELLHDAGDHAHGEVDQEDLPEEVRELEVVRLARPVPRGLEDRGARDEPDGEGHEEEVVDRGEPELPARQQERVQQFVHVRSSGLFYAP